MKTRFTLASLLILLSIFVFGQLEKGKIFIQGSSSMGINSDKYTYISGGTSTESSKSISFGFNPKVGFFVIDNLPVGLAINLDTYKSKGIGNDYVYVSNQFVIGPFARYYFVPQDKLKPMAQLYAGFGGSKDKSENTGYTSESKYGIVELSIGAGVSYFVTQNVAFDFLISYDTYKYNLKSESNTSGAKSTNSEDSSDKYAGIGFNIGVVVTIP